MNNNNYETPLATEESLEDADPLPSNYQVMIDTEIILSLATILTSDRKISVSVSVCSVFRFRFRFKLWFRSITNTNGSHLIYNKLTNDYQVIQERWFQHTH
jgi:hypothetical protein